MRRAIWILVLTAVPSAICAAQGPPDAPSVVAADGYGGVVAALEPFIQRELAEKGIPALSIALVDDQRIVWARGFGIANPKDSAKATAATIYRVGSVSKLFTDIGVMRLVERGTLDLDAPVSRYLPEFAPHNPFRGPQPPVTLRELMTHRAGLPLEAPVGSYVDSTTPTLAATVASLNEAALAYRPGSHTKYSNASATTAGYVIERTQVVPFSQWMDHEVLTPLGLRHSGFTLTAEMVPQLAAGTMWTYEGRRFPAPTFPIGESPAMGLYSSVTDLSRFISVMFTWGRGPHGPAVAPTSLAEMWRPQYDTTVEGVRYGLGFAISSLDGHRRVGHGGSVYGFATDLALLPEDRLGIVVICTLDGTGPVVTRIADTALRLMLAHRAGKPLETPQDFVAVTPQTAARLEGWYHAGTRGIYLEAQQGMLYARSARGGQRLGLRATGRDTLITDDRLGFGDRVLPLGFALIVDRDTLWRAEVPQPTPLTNRWVGLIGEYGWDYNSLIILERGGRLMALVDWFQEYPLTEVGPDTYAFPEWGLYDGEHIAFIRDSGQKGSTAVVGGVSYGRRALGPDDGSQFHITPVRPIEELRRAALAAQPPAESGSFNPTDLVDVTSLDSTIKLDIRYATSNNFLGVPVYTEAKAYLQRPAAEALVRVNRMLRRQGYGLLIHDAYRPWHVSKLFWDATPLEGKIFVADPSQGSNHNRGTAVDLTLFDTTSGKEVRMPGGYDEMSDRSYAYYPGGTSLERWRRDFLRRLMEQQGYAVYDAEWWHFDFGDPKKYRIGNLDFDHLVGSPPVITVRHLSGADELDACVRMQRETWGVDWIVPYPMLLVAQKTGGILAGAFDGDDPALLGFVFGMAGLVGGEIVHWSDMLAVRADARNRGIGRALKTFQRETVRAMGIKTMYWTYDPQVARNAHLNLNVLGAQVTEYVPDMYGPGTDRFIVRWCLDGQAPPVFGALAGRIEIPAPRAEFERAFAAGLRVIGFDRTHYLLAHP